MTLKCHHPAKYLKSITMDVGMVYIKAQLVEEKKRRLTFEVSVEDAKGIIYANSKVVNFKMIILNTIKGQR